MMAIVISLYEPPAKNTSMLIQTTHTTGMMKLMMPIMYVYVMHVLYRHVRTYNIADFPLTGLENQHLAALRSHGWTHKTGIANLKQHELWHKSSRRGTHSTGTTSLNGHRAVLHELTKNSCAGQHGSKLHKALTALPQDFGRRNYSIVTAKLNQHKHAIPQFVQTEREKILRTQHIVLSFVGFDIVYLFLSVCLPAHHACSLLDCLCVSVKTRMLGVAEVCCSNKFVRSVWRRSPAWLDKNSVWWNRMVA